MTLVPADDEDAAVGAYLLQLSQRWLVDASRRTRARAMGQRRARYGQPRERAVLGQPGALKACLRATRDIAAGEEIFVPYRRRLLATRRATCRQGQPPRRGRSSTFTAVAAPVAAAPPTATSTLARTELMRALRDAAASDTAYARRLRKEPEIDDGLTVGDGLLWRAGAPYSARLHRRAGQRDAATWLLAECHDAATAGHLGRDKTVAAVKRLFYWRGMDDDIAAYVAGCAVCQRGKASQQLNRGHLDAFPVPLRPFDSISMDLVTGLPPSRGFDAITVYVCRLTRYALIAPTRTTVTAEQLAQLTLQTVARAHGFPRTIVSDRDPRFTARFWDHYWRLSGTTLSMSTAYHPQTDGQTERANRTLEQTLRAYVRFDQGDWADHLWTAELAVNTAVQSSTGESPFSLVYGREASLPLDVALGPPRAGASECPAAGGLAVRQRAAWERAAQAIERAQGRQSTAANRHRRAARFSVGDKVWLAADKIKLAGADVRTSKLAERWLGPYVVTAVVNANAYRLDLPPSMRSMHPTVNIERLKPYAAADAERFPGRPAAPLRPAPATAGNNGQAEWEVADVVDRRTRQGAIQYLVLWRGYPASEATWEPLANLSNAKRMVERCDKRLRDRASARSVPVDRRSL